MICGFARTGEMWGSQTYGIKPDMISSAKALSAAMQPISAVLINERVHEAMLAQSDKFGNFAHGYTYAGHPVAAAVALEVQKIYAEMDIVGARQAAGPRAAVGARQVRGPSARRRRARHRPHPRHGADARRREAHPFDRALGVGTRVGAAAKRHGLIVRVVGDRLVFAPPLVIEAAEIEEIGVRLGRALDDVAAELA